MVSKLAASKAIAVAAALSVLLTVYIMLPVPVAATVGTLTVTTDTVLSEDHVGNVVIGANGVTLDCAGFTVQGPGSGTGISLSGKTAVTVKDCTVLDFGTGVFVSGGGGNVVLNVDVPWTGATRTGTGIYMTNSSNNTTTNSTATNRVYGIRLDGDSDSNTFLGSTVSTSTYAVYMRGDTGGNNFQSNNLSGNVNAIWAWDSLIGQGNTFQNNNLSNSTGWSLLINGDQLFTVSGNDFTNSANGIGLANMGGVSLSDANGSRPVKWCKSTSSC